MSSPVVRRSGEQIQYRSRMKTWVGRVTFVYADGRREKSPWTDLRTTNKELAQAAYDAWLAGAEPPVPGGSERFEAAAERILDEHDKEALAVQDEQRRAAAQREVRRRRYRLRTYAFAAMGQLDVVLIEPHHVASALDAAHKAGQSKGSCLKLRSDISVILKQLMRSGGVKVNAAEGVELHHSVRVDARPRTVPRDSDILLMRERRGFLEEVDMAVLIARDVAGQRTSDILAGDWSDVSLDTFTHWRVRRPKTDGDTGEFAIGRKVRSYEKVVHRIPPTVQGPLAAWWRRQGSPTTGPIFPAQRPSKAGTVKLADGRTYERRASQAGDRKAEEGNSYAQAFRDALWDAGIYKPLPGFDPENPRREHCAYQTDTKTTLRTDFHSLRRAYVTALKRAGTDSFDVLALAGHTQASTSSMYDDEREVGTPDAALPGGAIGGAIDPVDSALEALRSLLAPKRGANSGDLPPAAIANLLSSLASPRGLEPLTKALGMHGSAHKQRDSRLIAFLYEVDQTVSQPRLPQNAGQEMALRIGASLGVMIDDWKLVDKVRQYLTSPPSGVARLEDARARKGRR